MTLYPSRRGLLAGGAALAACGAHLPAWAQDRSAQDLAAEIAALFDPSASREARAVFWRDRLSDAGRRRWPQDVFQSFAEAVAATSGGVDVAEVRPLAEPAPGQLRIGLQARGGEASIRWVRARYDRDDASRLFDLSSFPIAGPYDRTGPTGPVSRETLALEIERRVRWAAERDEFSGAVLIGDPSGGTLWSGAFGQADREAGRPNRLDTPFHLGSADKSFTAIMIASLIREGRLGLNTPLIEVLPDYPNPSFARACTIHHLLAHGSGLGGLFDRPTWDRRAPYQRMSDLFVHFAAEPPLFEPGAGSGYSNEGYVVLGAVLEAVTGRSWYGLLAQRIYAPAGMTGSAHLRFDEGVGVKAVGYAFPEADILGFGPRARTDAVSGYRGNSCGGGYSTVEDMTRYLRALRAGRLMPADQLADFTDPAQGAIPNYGRGFVVRRISERTLVGHGGGGPRSGIDGDHAIVMETGWSLSIIGNYDAPFAGDVARDVGRWLALQDA